MIERDTHHESFADSGSTPDTEIGPDNDGFGRRTELVEHFKGALGPKDKDRSRDRICVKPLVGDGRDLHRTACRQACFQIDEVVPVTPTMVDKCVFIIATRRNRTFIEF